ncbi:F-box only protein 40 isoform X2 [Xiphophorus couchianus]|uniref:F-box only protein 40 isoform X2 n=1 Tax=Xiphophorus couchianus TaxID=32473 RepID=UPI0010168B5E|nr:F-box only protein 40 isoform X2 [Xiphophorus couchianus]
MEKGTKMAKGIHDHCDKCYSVSCQAPVNLSISCVVIKCHKNCGATFHMCKQEEHQLLCPNEMVPCFNVEFGCLLKMPRHKSAKHLEVCPASVVCCSQEWNRFPVPETDMTFYRNVSESLQPNTEANLDVALALRDQALLFQSIKMKSIFPEMMEEEPASPNISNGVSNSVEDPSCSLDCGEFTENRRAEMEGRELSQEETDALAKNGNVASPHNYNTWEKIFKKDKEGCNQAVKCLNNGGKEEEREEQKSLNCEVEKVGNKNSHQPEINESRNMNGATGLAPWQDGVLERLGKEVNVAEYNMYLVHNGAMLINFGQLAACTPREKDFVYGNLEPIEVQTVRSFNVPTSYRAKRSHLKDPSHKAKTAHQSVDTLDLDVSVENLPMSEEVSATLLCSLEKELKGHLISESIATDGLYVDIGTQTYNFSSAPFKADATLAAVIAGRPRGLYVDVETEPVTRRHNKISSSFSYMCGCSFRRDEFQSHFRNVHCDIQASLSGWFQQRCPLAYLGCTFSQIRFCPSGQEATIKYRQDVSTIVLQPRFPSSFTDAEKRLSPQGSAGQDFSGLSSLPLEILQHVAGYLDSFSLSQLSQVSRLMREVCATLLQDRGMVFLEWKKKTYSHGGSSWKSRKKIWRFSSLFSPVDRWSFSNAPSMSEHLKSCSFYQREERREPAALACLQEVREKHQELKHKR